MVGPPQACCTVDNSEGILSPRTVILSAAERSRRISRAAMPFNANSVPEILRLRSAALPENCRFGGSESAIALVLRPSNEGRRIERGRHACRDRGRLAGPHPARGSACDLSVERCSCAVSGGSGAAIVERRWNDVLQFSLVCLLTCRGNDAGAPFYGTARVQVELVGVWGARTLFAWGPATARLLRRRALVVAGGGVRLGVTRRPCTSYFCPNPSAVEAPWRSGS